MKGVFFVGLKFKIDVLEALKDAGYNTYCIKQNKLLSESTVQKLRQGDGIGWKNIETICELLNCQPGDILEYVPDHAEGEGE